MLVAGLTGCLITLLMRVARLEDKMYDAKAALALRIAHAEEAIDEVEVEVSGLKKTVGEIPIEEIIQRNKDEEAYFAGLQNIFNYGDNVPKLNLDGIAK